MKIFFYNGANNGDLFFIKELIKITVLNNHNYDFFLAIRFSSYIFNDITSLQIIKHDSDFDNSKMWFIKDEDLYINTWCRGQFNFYDIEEFGNYFKTTINEINNNTQFKLIFPDTSKNCIIPRLFNNFVLPTKYIDLVNKFDNKIFYYNVNSNSGQFINYDHDHIIEKLSQTYKLIVAKESKIKNENIINLFDEGIIQNNNGDNLIFFAYIAGLCNTIIMKDCGSCFFSFCYENMISENKQKIILFRQLIIANSLNKFILNNNKNLYLINLFNSNDIIDHIKNLI